MFNFVRRKKMNDWEFVLCQIKKRSEKNVQKIKELT
jgi:hypothetical protein